jgi:hypothetical protein
VRKVVQQQSLDCDIYLHSRNDNHLRVSSLGSVSGAVDLAINTVDVRTSVLVGSTWASDVDVLNVDVGAYCRAGADQVSNERVVLLTGGTVEVLDGDVGDGEV